MPHERAGRHRVPGAAIGASVLGLLACACADSATAPSPVVNALSIAGVVPAMVPSDTSVDIRIIGTGFRAGATVTVGGPASNVVVASSTLITATAPPHSAGTDEVVVTNPDGRAARLRGLTFVPLSIASVAPQAGFAGGLVTITGTGFLEGATVTIGGRQAEVKSFSPTSPRTIVVAFPADLAGTVDVVVTNPGGQSATLTGAMTVLAVSLTASPDAVAPGGQLTLSWSSPGRGNTFDWIGLFKVGDANENYGWWEYVSPRDSGTLIVAAPTVPGEYEFRYLLDDGYVHVARSNRVTVRAGG